MFYADEINTRVSKTYNIWFTIAKFSLLRMQLQRRRPKAERWDAERWDRSQRHFYREKRSLKNEPYEMPAEEAKQNECYSYIRLHNIYYYRNRENEKA